MIMSRLLSILGSTCVLLSGCVPTLNSNVCTITYPVSADFSFEKKMPCQIWNSKGRGDRESSVISFFGRKIKIGTEKNNIVVSDAATGQVLAGHLSGWSGILQTIAVIDDGVSQHLVVIKGVRTYENCSKIHIFDSDFQCRCETQIPGRGWFVVSCGRDKKGLASILIENDQNCNRALITLRQ